MESRGRKSDAEELLVSESQTRQQYWTEHSPYHKRVSTSEGYWTILRCLALSLLRALTTISSATEVIDDSSWVERMHQVV